MKSSPTVSVVIPTLNSPFIEHTLAGLQRQSYDLTKVEVLVVGQDAAGRIRPNDLVRFIETAKPEPPAVSRNIGLLAAGGDIVCFTDDDCAPDPNWIAGLVSAYAEAGVDVVGGGIHFPPAGYWARCDALASAYEYLVFRGKGLRRQLPSMNFSARRAVLLSQQGFDETYPFASGEDADLCMRLRRQGHQLHFVPEAIIDHLGWRKTAPEVLGHIYRYGQFSPWIKPELGDIVNPPFFFDIGCCSCQSPRYWPPGLRCECFSGPPNSFAFGACCPACMGPNWPGVGGPSPS